MGHNDKAESILRQLARRRGDSESRVNMMLHLINTNVQEAVRQGEEWQSDGPLKLLYGSALLLNGQHHKASQYLDNQ